MRWVILCRFAKSLLTVYQDLHHMESSKTYDFFRPEGHLSMTKTAVVVNSIGSIYKAVPAVCLTSDVGL
jgi:hypothetical protein